MNAEIYRIVNLATWALLANSKLIL